MRQSLPGNALPFQNAPRRFHRTLAALGALAALATALALAPHAAVAATYSWNTGDGTWNDVSSNWSGAGPIWVDGNTAHFTNTAPLSTTSIAITGTRAASDASAGDAAVPPTVNRSWSFTGGTLQVAGPLVFQGNQTNNGNYGANPRLTFDSAVSVAGDTLIGRANMTIAGGTYSTRRFTANPASADWANLVIAGGTVTASEGIDGTYGTSGSNGTFATFQLSLEGGVLLTPSIKVANREAGLWNDAVLTFNGAVVKATRDAEAFVTLYGGNQSAFIASGGAIIDTNGHDIGIGVNLKNAAGQSGAFVKQGPGTLTLSGSNAYTGPTTVASGTLELAGTFLADASAVNIDSGATLRLSHGATDVVSALAVSGSALPPGVYGASTPSTAGFIAGSGSIQVGLNPPANFAAVPASLAGIDLSWTAPAYLPEGYTIERASNGGDFIAIAQVAGGATTYRDAAVEPGVTYSYRIASRLGATAFDASPAASASLVSGSSAFPASTFLATRDYGTMWWRSGVRGERVWNLKTSRYALTFECDTLNLSTIFPLANTPTETAALTQPQDQSFPASAPASSLNCTLTYSGTAATIRAFSNNNDDAQLVESGKFYQRRWQKLKILSGPALDAARSGIEVCAWPDRVSVICRVVPTVAVTDGGLHMALNLQSIYNQLTSSGAAKALSAADGSGFVFVKSGSSDALAVDPANARVTLATNGGTWPANEERSVGLVIYPARAVAETLAAADRAESQPLLVTATQVAPAPAALSPRYDLDRGHFDIPLRNDVPGSDENRVERNEVVVTNTTSTPQIARFAFTKAAFPQEAGYSCLLRDADGYPLGIPVQLSKNWHVGSGDRWQGPWFHGLTMFTVPANTTLRFEALLVGQNYGGVPAASHSQLSLIGWGANQQWEEAAIGCWGENLCYEPDADQAAAIGTDSRPMLLLTSAGAPKGWTGNYGGCDFLRYFDGSNTRRYHKRIRTAYRRYGPNLTDVTYAGLTDNATIEFQYGASIYRSNDYVRGRHRIRYDVKSNAPFTRMVFFQMAADSYNYNGGNAHAYGYGNQAAPTAQWTTTNVTTPVELTGTLPWFSTLNCPVDSRVPSQSGASRGFIIRSWKARINGVDNVNPRFVSSGSRFDIVPPSGVSTLKAGDYVEAEIERVYFGQTAAAYYGGDANYTTALGAYGNTHQLVIREAIGNALAVSVSKGALERSYPIQVRAAHNTAEFTATRGVGYVPITVTGLTDYRKPRLEELVSGTWVAVDQSVAGKDFWQTDYDPDDASWQITFNVKLDGTYQDIVGLRDAPVTRTFRFLQEGTPSAVVSPLGAAIPGVASEGSIQLQPGDLSLDGLSVLAVSSDPTLISGSNVFVAGSGSSRFISFTPTPWQQGSATLYLHLIDSEGKTTVQAVPVVVDGYLAWKGQFFGGLSDPAIIGDGQDPDRDGANNGDEYLAGTDPLDPADRFAAPISMQGGLTTLSLDGRAGRTYRFERSATLSPGAWQEIGRTDLLPHDQDADLTDPAPPGSTTFYRLRAVAP